MQLSEITNIVRAVFDEVTAARFSDLEITAWANEGERDVAAKTGCLETVSLLQTTANSRIVAFSGNRVNAVEYITGGYVSVITDEGIKWYDTTTHTFQDTTDMIWQDNNALSTQELSMGLVRVTPHHMGHIPLTDSPVPQYYFQWGSSIVIEPLPLSVYDLNVYTSYSPTAEMVDTTDTPEIPSQFHEAIALFATVMGELKIKRFANAALTYQEYINTLNRLIVKYMARHYIPLGLTRLPNINLKRM